ncbi:substrate-binding domain-containing protein [Polaromonas sp. SM01]|uniref:molybdate ABC transporter substrate-binding protein n=1 Tax=Polaromonas sp. SM01 TaxID=3085630 RepID=UPI002980BDD5|nr:substrate-binding domain-containing protein [Polaromonas sp. SM01]MDW5442457.1 substrate-binding domain-containing protein [Polaromonas sp. SM01]
MSTLHLLSGGAAKGLVTALRARFLAQTGLTIEGHFDAVGIMKDQLLAGSPCDVVILTDALITQLTESCDVTAGSARPLGIVKTGIAVRDGATPPPLATVAQLRQALLSATAIYFPDPVKATAGIHFMKVMQLLGVAADVAGRLRPHPNGAAAMHALAQSEQPGAIGCTQATEIIFAPGVQLAAALPQEFELATVYTAAVSSRAVQPRAAATLIELLTSTEAAGLRSAGGFEPVAG